MTHHGHTTCRSAPRRRCRRRGRVQKATESDHDTATGGPLDPFPTIAGPLGTGPLPDPTLAGPTPDATLAGPHRQRRGVVVAGVVGMLIAAAIGAQFIVNQGDDEAGGDSVEDADRAAPSSSAPRPTDAPSDTVDDGPSTLLPAPSPATTRTTSPATTVSDTLPEPAPAWVSSPIALSPRLQAMTVPTQVVVLNTDGILHVIDLPAGVLRSIDTGVHGPNLAVVVGDEAIAVSVVTAAKRSRWSTRTVRCTTSRYRVAPGRCWPDRAPTTSSCAERVVEQPTTARHPDRRRRNDERDRGRPAPRVRRLGCAIPGHDRRGRSSTTAAAPTPSTLSVPLGD